MTTSVVPDMTLKRNEFFEKAIKFRNCKLKLLECTQDFSLEALSDYPHIDFVSTGVNTFNKNCRQVNIGGNVINNLEELYVAANVAYPIFSGFVVSMLNDIDISNHIFKCPPLKGRDRASQKARDDYEERLDGPGISWLFDIVRGSIDCNCPDQICSILDYLTRETTPMNSDSLDYMTTFQSDVLCEEQPMTIVEHSNKNIRIIRFKNRFREPTPGGFQDLNLSILIPIGCFKSVEAVSDDEFLFYHVCELQIHLAPLHQMAKELNSHNLYEFFRVYFRGDQSSVESRMDLLSLVVKSHAQNHIHTNSNLDGQEDAGIESDFFDLEALMNAALKAEADTLNRANYGTERTDDEAKIAAVSNAVVLENIEKLLYLLCDYHLLVSMKTTQLNMKLGALSTLSSIFESRALASSTDITAATDYYEQVEQGLDVSSITSPDLAAENETSDATSKATDIDSTKFSSQFSSQTAGPLVQTFPQCRSLSTDAAELHMELAKLYTSLGDDSRALSSYKSAVDLREQWLGATHLQTLISVLNWGVVLETRGQYGPALTCYHRAYDGVKNSMGEENEHALLALSRCARMQQVLGDWMIAQAMFERCLQLRLRVYGEDHVGTLSILDHAACFFLSTGEPRAAVQIMQQALATREKLLGACHEDTLHNIQNMGTIQLSMRDFAGARVLFERSMHGAERLLGPDHDMTLCMATYLGETLAALGELTLASEYLTNAVTGLRRALGDGHQYTIKAVCIQQHVLRLLHPELEGEGETATPRNSDSSSTLSLTLSDFDRNSYSD